MARLDPQPEKRIGVTFKEAMDNLLNGDCELLRCTDADPAGQDSWDDEPLDLDDSSTDGTGTFLGQTDEPYA